MVRISVVRISVTVHLIRQRPMHRAGGIRIKCTVTEIPRPNTTRRAMGFRFSNSVVRQNLDGVMYSIMMVLEREAEISPPVSRRRREPPSP